MSTDEDGIGMIEIVVAMFVLALLALSFLPVLTSNLLVARQSAETASATQIVSTQLEAVRRGSATCAAVKSFASPTTATVGGRTFNVARTNPGSCAAPGATIVTVSVSLAGSTAVLAEAQTRLFVGAAS